MSGGDGMTYNHPAFLLYDEMYYPDAHKVLTEMEKVELIRQYNEYINGNGGTLDTIIKVGIGAAIGSIFF
jgi:hypothetical protein